MATDPVQPRWTLLDIVNQCDSFPYSPDPKLEQLSFLDFIVDDIAVGRIHSSLVPHLTAFNQTSRPVFHITESSVSFMPWLSDYDSRTGAIAQMLVKAPLLNKDLRRRTLRTTGTSTYVLTHILSRAGGRRTNGERTSTSLHASPVGETSSMASTPTSTTHLTPKEAPP